MCFWNLSGENLFLGEFGPQFRVYESQSDGISAQNIELMYHIDQLERSFLPVMSVWVDNCRFHHVVPNTHFGAT